MAQAAIGRARRARRQEWRRHMTDRANSALFFAELHRQLANGAIMAIDHGNHTFLAAELFEVRPRCFVSSTDFSS